MGPERRAYRGDGGPPTVDALVARFAAEHFGVISAGHLAAFGLSDDQIHRRVRSGRLHRLFPKVYAVGHTALPVRGHWLAAVWACGPNAVLSHRDAACLWGFRENHRPAIEVTTTDRGRKGHGNIDLHRTRRLASEDVTSRDGIPVTSVARTFVDLAAILDEDGLRKALKQAGIKRLLDVRAIEAAIARSPGRRTVALASLVHVPPAPTESELEDAFLALVRRAGLPDPLMNAHVSTGQGVKRVDFLWPEHRLAVELDGREFHDTADAFQADRVRDVEMLIAGLRVARFTWLRVMHDAHRVEAQLRALMGR